MKPQPLHSVWKDKATHKWKVQCPCGIMTLRTRKQALAYARAAHALRLQGHGV